MATKIASLYAEIGADTSGLDKGLAHTKQGLEGAGKAAQTTGDKISKFAMGFGTFAATAGVTALGAAFVASTKSAMDLESEFGKLAALTDTPKAAIAELRKEVLSMSTELPVSAQELSEALYFISSSGFQGADAMKILNASALAATAGLGETKVIADAVTSALNAYGTGASDAARITDLLTYAVKEGKGEPAELAAGLGRVLPVAAAAGIGMEDIAAAIAVMTRTSGNADEAFTALRGTIGALLAPAKQSVDAMLGIGLTTQNVSDMLKQPGGLVDVLRLMMERTGGNVEQLDLMIPNIRALTGVLSLAGAQGEEYAAVLQGAYEAQELTTEAAKTMGDTMEAKLKKAQNSVENLGVAVTEKLLPGLGQAADAVTLFITAGDKLDEALSGVNAQLAKSDMAYFDYADAVLGAAVNAGKLSQVEKDAFMSGQMTEQGRWAVYKVTKLLNYEERELQKSQAAVAQGASNLAETQDKIQEAMMGLGSSMKEGKPAIDEVSDSLNRLSKEEQKVANAAGDMMTSYLDATEGFKKIDSLNVARGAMEQLSALMKSDPENIDVYKNKYEELQLAYGLITPAAQAAQQAAQGLTSMLIAGVIGPDQYKAAVERLQKAAQDGKVSVSELGLAGEAAGKALQYIEPQATAAAQALLEVRKKADEARDALYQMPNKITIGVVYDIGEVPENIGAGGAAPRQHASAGAGGVAYSAPKATKPIVKGYARGADFIVPPGYSHDNYPLFVNSGERVMIDPQGRGAQNTTTTNNVSINIGAISRDYTPQQAGDEIINRMRSRGLIA